jgi:threonine synthase
MLAQIQKYGATVLTLTDKAHRWPLIAQGAARLGWFAASPFHSPVVGSHPLGIEGYKTIAYEIVEQLNGQVPEWCALPVCYGDALAGVWQGFKDLLHQEKIDRLPRLIAAEVHGSLAKALEDGVDAIPTRPAAFDTLAVSIGTTKSTYQALKALRESKGLALPIGNSDLIRFQEQLAASEGLFAELASITPLAAIAALRERRVIAASDRVVAVVTASGLKDVDRSVGSGEQTSFRSVGEAWESLSRNEALCRPAEEFA